MSKKICFVTTVSSSIDAFIFPYVSLLKEKGFSVTFATTCREGFQEKCEKEGIRVYNIPVGRGFDFRGMAVAVKKFYQICKQEQFDMVFYATPNAALYASIASRAAKIPCRVLGHWGLRYLGEQGWKRRLVRNLEKISCINSTDIRMVSESNRAIAIQDGMYKPEKCKVIGKGGTVGVNLELYKKESIPTMRKEIREKFGIPEDALTYIFIGRICRDKGVGELIAAFEQVQQKKTDAYLMLLGLLDDNAMLPEELLSRAKENPHIIFCGRVPNVEVSAHLAAADVLVHPAYREGLGMVLLEAAAMFLPTITTNIPGASEAIVNGETGLLAEKQDVDTLVNAMVALFDENLRHTLGTNGRERIEKHFDRNIRIELLCQDYEELYEKRVANKM